MAKPAPLILALALCTLVAATPVTAAQRFPNIGAIFGTVSLGCALDYTNSNETRMIVTNTTGQSVVAGSKLSWTTDASSGAFFLKRAIPAGEVFSFGLNAKGLNCTVKARPPELVRTPN